MSRSLTRNVLLFSGAFILLVAVAAAWTLNSVGVAQRAVQTVATDAVGEVISGYGFRASIQRVIAEAHSYGLTGSPDKFAAVQVALTETEVHLAAIQTHGERDRFNPQLYAEHMNAYQQRLEFVNQTKINIAELTRAVNALDAVAIAAAVAQLEAQDHALSTLEEQVAAELERDVRESLDEVAKPMRYIFWSISIAFGLVVFLAGLSVGLLQRKIVAPVRGVAHAAAAVAAGNLSSTVPVTNRDEIGNLQQAFNDMLHNLRSQRSSIEEQNQELHDHVAKQQQLLDTVKQLSTPLLPVTDDVVVLPIVGHIDTQRAQELTSVLLHGVVQRRARAAILDISGIATVDTHVIGFVLSAMQATELLGTKALLAGISAHMAQIMVEQGIELGKIQTYRSLHMALDHVLFQPALA